MMTSYMRDFNNFVLKKHKLRICVTSTWVTLFDSKNEFFCRVHVHRGKVTTLNIEDIPESKKRFIEVIRAHMTRRGDRVVKVDTNQCTRKRCIEHLTRAFPDEWLEFSKGIEDIPSESKPPKAKAAIIDNTTVDKLVELLGDTVKQTQDLRDTCDKNMADHVNLQVEKDSNAYAMLIDRMPHASDLLKKETAVAGAPSTATSRSEERLSTHGPASRSDKTFVKSGLPSIRETPPTQRKETSFRGYNARSPTTLPVYRSSDRLEAQKIRMQMVRGFATKQS